LLFGQAGEAQFSDACVKDPNVIALRDRVEARADPAIAEASADLTLTLRDGRTFRKRVEHAVGSLERPMSDAVLDQKVHGLVDPVLGTAKADALLRECEALPRAANVYALVVAARPDPR